MLCAKCNNAVTDFASCSLCEGNFHYGCAGVTESGYRRMGLEKKAAWRCMSCRTKSTETGGSAIAEVLKEIRNLRVDFNAMKMDFGNVQADIRSTKTSMQELNTKWNKMESRFSGIEDRLLTAETKLSSLTSIQKEYWN
ncbi:unnamed protein product [Diatraea saccharalis]|uniref:PHD-type domain-containing protein n=1 Tax=Diatraea saccharalis TaxID=40085 RepID=A0A9N9WF25_9NEOP|nr:unnamed protein product [Diatraea saccharalis]